jgi:WD40 repeat protein
VTGEFLGTSLQSLSLDEPPPPSLPAVSPGGARTLTRDNSGVVRILDAASGDVIAQLPGYANAAAWSPDGASVAVAMANGTVQIWKAE